MRFGYSFVSQFGGQRSSCDTCREDSRPALQNRKGSFAKFAVSSRSLAAHEAQEQCLLQHRGLGGTGLDQSQPLSLVPDQGALAGRCRSCAIGQWVTGDGARHMAPYVTERIDDDVVVLSNPELDGLIVIPRQHIGGIDGLSVLDRAHLLAALRRVAQSVLERYPGPATRIVVFTDPPATEGHLCFHVKPGGPGDPVLSPFGRS
jgi:hypothetical protein